MRRFVGTKLSHYRILRKIGSGGMGVVYQAQDQRLGRQVALKVLPPRMLSDARSRARFRREALALSNLNHPNIATVYEFDTENEVDFLVMEFIHGSTLAERVRGGSIPGVQALNIARQVATALECAHEQGIIHRDLKPGNVMVKDDGLVKVLDFGLAQRRKGRFLGSDMTMGTPGYMSPEQIEGKDQDERADIFSFGCVLFECLAGERAFDGDTPEAVIDAVLAGEPRWEALPKTTPPTIRSLLIRSLEKDAGKRLAAIRDARAVLEDVLSATASRRGEMHVLHDAPNNLPTPATSFVGRQKALEECRTLLGHARLLTLTGAGGSGKTRLALRLAEDVVHGYPDGIWFVDLGDIRDEARVPLILASAIGVGEETGRTQVETIAQHLHDRRVLIVLDNCEYLVRTCAALSHALLTACPYVVVLATSREVLRVPGEHSYVVPPLELSDEESDPLLGAGEAERLFAERASSVSPGFAITKGNASSIAAICRRLDGIPLAIELAAARIRMLSVDEILSKLDHMYRLLGERPGESRPGRQALRATVEWSYEQLVPDEQRLFRMLAVFAGGWTFESAMAVCGLDLDEFTVLDLLGRLLDKSLIVVTQTPDKPRYRFLETIREYATERLCESGDEDSHNRHLDHFLVLAEEARPKLGGGDQGRWLARLEAEQDNMLAAIDWGRRSRGAEEKALRLASSIWPFWIIRCRFEAGRRTLREVLAIPGVPRVSVARAEALRGLGSTAFNLNAWSESRTSYDESYEIASELRDSVGMASSLIGLGNAALGEADYTAAQAQYERALEIFRVARHERGIGVALSNAGRASELQGNYAAARALYEEGLVLLRKAGDMVAVGMRLSSLAELSIRLGDLDGARKRLIESLQIVLQLSDKRAGAYALERSAALLERLGDSGSAAVLHGASNAIRERTHSPLTPRERSEQDAVVVQLHANLGEQPFLVAWEEGRKLGFEGAIEMALQSLSGAAPRSGRRRRPRASPAILPASDRRAATLKNTRETLTLLEGVRRGDEGASARLVKRYMPILRRWAHGRLPRTARDVADTDDIVQVALIRGLNRVPEFEHRHTGAFLAYLRQIVRNALRDEIRKSRKRALRVELSDDLIDERPSPLEEAVGKESLAHYEEALAKLPKKQREAIVMRLEMGFSLREIAKALRFPSDEAAGAAIRRSLPRLLPPTRKGPRTRG